MNSTCAGTSPGRNALIERSGCSNHEGAGGGHHKVAASKGEKLGESPYLVFGELVFLPDEGGVEIPVPDCHAGYFAAGRPWWNVYCQTLDRVDYA